MIIFDKNKDSIAIIAPSSLPQEADSVFLSAVNLLQEHGFLVKYHPEILSRKALDFFAARKSVRIEALKQALEDPEVKIIWAFRGGYGATEILPDCYDFISLEDTSENKSFQNKLPENKSVAKIKDKLIKGKPIKDKLLIGFSDITALHVLFNQRFYLPSLHAPVLTSILGKQSAMFEEVLNLFSTGGAEYKLSVVNENAAKVTSPINAKIIGGNLAVFCNLIGTKLHPDTAGKILILEDIDEKGYEIHRFFIHLYNAGLLDSLAAVILGDFTKGDRLVQSAIDDICYRYLTNVPVYRLEGFGHGDKNHPVVLGEYVKIECNIIKDNKITIDNNFVKDVGDNGSRSNEDATLSFISPLKYSSFRGST